MGRLSLDEVVKLIDDREQAVSVIRLGDGEAGLIESWKKCAKMWPLTSESWCYRYLMGQAWDWRRVARELVAAISLATVVGTPDPGDKTCHGFKEILNEDIGQHTCSNNLNRTLFENRPLILNHWFKTRRVGIFYHDTIMARRRYADILGLPVGDFAAQRAMFRYVYPFRSIVEPGVNWAKNAGINLALVSGGPAGKVLCVELQKIGIDALDVGQAIDR